MMRAYLQKASQVGLRVLKNKMHVSGDGDPGRDLDATVQHPQESVEFRVLDDAERTVTGCNPHNEMVSEAGLGVGGA